MRLIRATVNILILLTASLWILPWALRDVVVYRDSEAKSLLTGEKWAWD